MTKLYAAYGKQVMRDGEPFADACDETAAQIIADALNGERERAPVEQLVPDDPYSFTAVDPISFSRGGSVANSIEVHHVRPEDNFTVIAELHHVTQRPDGDYHCTCGRGWDRDEGDECPGDA